jgi:uncharacterized protein (TIGR02145 family)
MKESDIILLCHAPQDRSRVIELHAHLQRAGLHPSIGEAEAPPPADWDHEIQQTMQASRFVILCFSLNFVSSVGHVQRQLDIAIQVAKSRMDDRIFLIPVRLDNCKVPASYSHLQHVDVFEKSGIESVIQLIKAELRLFTDPRDGLVYRTVEIGGQTWLAENLKYEVASSWCYGDNPRNLSPYGRLYIWDAAREASPPGWHLPDDSEWRRLALTVGGYRDMDQGYPRTGMKVGSANDAFKALIQNGASGFDAPLAGYRTRAGDFDQQGAAGLYWSGTPYTYTGDFHVETAWIYIFYTLSGQPELRRDYEFPSFRAPEPLTRQWALSVRCVRDA